MVGNMFNTFYFLGSQFFFNRKKVQTNNLGWSNTWQNEVYICRGWWSRMRTAPGSLWRWASSGERCRCRALGGRCGVPGCWRVSSGTRVKTARTPRWHWTRLLATCCRPPRHCPKRTTTGSKPRRRCWTAATWEEEENAHGFRCYPSIATCG